MIEKLLDKKLGLLQNAIDFMDMGDKKAEKLLMQFRWLMAIRSHIMQVRRL